MVLLKSLFVRALTLINLLQQPSAAQEESPPPLNITIGTDGPASPATTSYWINHAGLNVNNLTASMHFYGTVLGMRHVFTIQYTDSFSMTYMGFSQGGRNGSGFQTGEELMRFKNEEAGLVKLLYFSGASGEVVAGTRRTSGVANLGLVVEDIEAAEKRFEEFGVNIVKPRGVTKLEGESPVAVAFNVGPDSTDDASVVDAIVEGLKQTDLENIVFIEDPDGNLLEVISRDGF